MLIVANAYLKDGRHRGQPTALRFFLLLAICRSSQISKEHPGTLAPQVRLKAPAEAPRPVRRAPAMPPKLATRPSLLARLYWRFALDAPPATDGKRESQSPPLARSAEPA